MKRTLEVLSQVWGYVLRRQYIGISMKKKKKKKMKIKIQMFLF